MVIMVFTIVWDMWYWKVCFDLIWFDLIWFDLIWFDLTRHSKSHWKQHSLRKGFILLHCRFASNKYFSISFPFSRFRCSCSRKSHSRNAERMGWKLEKTTFLSLAERIENNSIVIVIAHWVFVGLTFCYMSKDTYLTYNKTILKVDSYNFNSLLTYID